MENTQRLHILNDDDLQALYDRPKFTEIERRHFFNLPDNLLESLNIRDKNPRRVPGLVYFILQYGYFKAKHQFFTIHFYEVHNDVDFIMTYFLPNDAYPTKLPSRDVQRESKKTILMTLNYSDDQKEVRQKLSGKINQFIRRSPDPVEVFDEAIKYLTDQRCMVLGYKVMQDLIGAAFKAEEDRLCREMAQQLPTEVKESLEKLMIKGAHHYLITTLQCDAKSFQHQEMQKELEKLALCHNIYKFSQHFLSCMDLSQSMIAYYADLIHVYKTDRLKKMERLLAYFYLICYVQFRYERITNNLVQGFVYHVDKYHNDAKRYADSQLPSDPGLVESYDTQLGKLIEIFTKKKIMEKDGPSIEKYAFDIMPEETIISVSQKLLNRNQQKIRRKQALIWAYHKKQYHAVTLNLRPLFLTITFENLGEVKDLFKACRFWKKLLNSNKRLSDYMPSRIPMDHIKPKALRDRFKEIINTKKGPRTIINAHQYEFYLYRALRENIKQRKVAINSSTEYKSFEAEVKIPKDWKKTAPERLAALNNKKIIQPINAILNDLELILEPMIERTNHRALNGENKYIKIVHHRDGNIRWTLPYPKKNSEFDNPFYKQLETQTISEIFDFVEKECHFMHKFRHIKSRGGLKDQDHLAIKGVILANGTMQGTNLFARRSNLNYKRLKTAEENHIRLNTLRSAADVIIDKMIDLPIFGLYLINNNLHGSVDGKKRKRGVIY